jgi:hypothetical protein
MKGRSHRFSSWFVRCTCVLLASAWLAGCGESGSNPPELPEIRFEIMPLLGGTVRFEIVEVRAGGVVFRSLAGQAIQAVAAVNVFVENAAAPFSIMVRLLESNPVLVRYRLTGSSGPGSAVVDAVWVHRISPGCRLGRRHESMYARPRLVRQSAPCSMAMARSASP